MNEVDIKNIELALAEGFKAFSKAFIKTLEENTEENDFETLLRDHLRTECKQFTVYETVGENRRPIESGLIDVSDCTTPADQNRMLQSHLEYLKTVRSDWADKILSINCPLANHLR